MIVEVSTEQYSNDKIICDYVIVSQGMLHLGIWDQDKKPLKEVAAYKRWHSYKVEEHIYKPPKKAKKETL